MSLQFQHFQTRLLVYLLLPLLLVLGAIYFAVDRANTANANAIIKRDLETGVTNFNAAINDRNENLAIASDALTGDYAFRQAYNTDRLTLLSAINNLLGRIASADFIAMVDAGTHQIKVDTHRPQLQGVAPEWLPLITAAEALDNQGKFPEASDVIVLDGHPYHVTVLPFLNPGLAAWVAIGFDVGGSFTADFKRSVSADVSVLFKDADKPWQISGSTLPEPLPAQLATAFSGSSGPYTQVQLGGEAYVSLASPLSKSGDVQVLLQRSLAAQLQPFKSLEQRLFTIFAIGVIMLLLLLTLLSRTVTRPLELLTGGARRIAAGDYRQQVEIPHKDEIGELAAAFNAMAIGLAEKEQVRALLGKVVSPAIANELMSKQPELGGEEREVTVLFTDIRGFTAMCEGYTPRQILALLNDCFTMLSAVIEQHDGVVDKYIGDALMALFGAPVADAAAATKALHAALAIKPALAGLNRSLLARGLAPLTMGIGINTARVVVGNMGSQSRLNYTAIGDGVNLASRLEGLNKLYHAPIIASASTAAAAPQFLWLPLDLVRVKGRQEPVRVFEPLCERNAASAALLAAVSLFETFLQKWQTGDWPAAAELLEHYASAAGKLPEINNGLIALYRQRLQLFRQSTPTAWDGVCTYDEK
jgi:adenylate cyclase